MACTRSPRSTWAARWRDDPTPLLQSLQSYLTIEDPEAAPDRVFARGAITARAAAERLVAQVRRTPGGWWRARVAGFAAGCLRALGGIREFPKFFGVRMLGLAHDALLASGRELAEQGARERAEDIFFLRLHELATAAEGKGMTEDWRALVAARRAVYERERRRTRLPRVLLSDGRAFYGGLNAAPGTAAGTLAGSPVSPGTAEGLVRIVLDPHSTQLAPGEILVCPGTDPAWTPLFLSAGALVMEVGGLMTHGAVVARASMGSRQWSASMRRPLCYGPGSGCGSTGRAGWYSSWTRREGDSNLHHVTAGGPGRGRYHLAVFGPGRSCRHPA
jgi:rifampicin phosphotransferase